MSIVLSLLLFPIHQDKTGSAPIQETEQPPLPLAAPCNVANTHLVSCQVVHRPAAMERDAQGCCEVRVLERVHKSLCLFAMSPILAKFVSFISMQAVKAELKADFQTLKTEVRKNSTLTSQ